MPDEPAHFLSHIEDEERRNRIAIRAENLKRLGAEQKEAFERERRELAARVARHFQRAFDLLEVTIVEASEIGKLALDQTPESVPVAVRMAHHGLLARGLLTSWEILAMLRSGHGHGAYARWRTLFELSAVAEFLHQHGHEAAERFRDHYSIETRRYLSTRFPGIESNQSSAPVETIALFNRLTEERSALGTKYDKAFLEDYGWAAKWVGARANIHKISKALPALEKTRPDYRSASYYVHAGTRGTLDHHSYTAEGGLELLSNPNDQLISRPGRLSAVSIALLASQCVQATETQLEDNVLALGAVAVEATEAFRQGHRAWVIETRHEELAWQE